MKGATRGVTVLKRFLEEVETGKIRKTPTTLKIAKAFREILDHGVDSRHALGLQKSRGRPSPLYGDRLFSQFEPLYPIWTFVFERIEQGSEEVGRPSAGGYCRC